MDAGHLKRLEVLALVRPNVHQGKEAREQQVMCDLYRAADVEAGPNRKARTKPK